MVDAYNTKWVVGESIDNGILTSFCEDGKWVIFAQIHDENHTFVNTSIYTSADGKSWEIAGTLPIKLGNIVYGNGIYVGVNGLTIYSSNDLANWSTTTITITAAYIYSIVYGGGRFLLTTNNGLDAPFYSDDGVKWTQLANKIGNDTLYHTVVYLNGAWYAVGGNTKIPYRSTDAITWTRVNSITVDVYAPTYYDGLYMAVIKKSSSNQNAKDYYYSQDGISWTTGTIFGNAKTAPTIKNAGGMWFARLSSTGTYYSRDGINWSPTNVTNWYLDNIVYGNGIFVASTNGHGMMYSTDGVNWEQANITDFALIPKYANKLFVASMSLLAAANNGIWHSADGETWEQSNITAGTVIGYGSGAWVGCTGHYVGYSVYAEQLIYLDPEPEPEPVPTLPEGDFYKVVNGQWVKHTAVKSTGSEWVKQDGHLYP